MTEIRLKCTCGAAIPLPVQKIATTVRDRSCTRCKARWRIVATPKPFEAGVVYISRMTCTRDGVQR